MPTDYCTLDQVIGRVADEFAVPPVTALAGMLPNAEGSTDAEKAQISQLITECSRFIDTYVGGGGAIDIFAPATLSSRYIHGNGSSLLRLPFHTRGSIELDSIIAIPSEGQPTVYLETKNGDLFAVDAVGNQITKVISRSSGYAVAVSNDYWGTNSSCGGTTTSTLVEPFPILTRFEIAAIWGFETIPSDIEKDCLELVTRAWRSKDDGFSGVIESVNRDNSIIERSMPAPTKTNLDLWRLWYAADTVDYEDVPVVVIP